MKRTCLLILAFVLPVALTCPKTYGEERRKSVLEELEANTAKVEARTAELEANTAKRRQLQEQAEKQAATTAEMAKKQAIAPAPALLPAPQIPAPERLLVNVLLIDPVKLTVDYFEEVLVSDIVQWGNHTCFLYDGKSIDWDKTAARSYPYRHGDPTVIGAVSDGAKIIAVNVPAHNVYIDNDDEIWWENPEGGYSHVQKGRYITTQSVLTNQESATNTRREP